MYTQLLDVAYGEPARVEPSAPSAIDELVRCRGELDGAPADGEPDHVPATLAREIGYDVALLHLAGVLGIETDPSRFEQPWRERERLELAFRARGISLP
jgi:hypothetical protein